MSQTFFTNCFISILALVGCHVNLLMNILYLYLWNQAPDFQDLSLNPLLKAITSQDFLLGFQLKKLWAHFWDYPGTGILCTKNVTWHKKSGSDASSDNIGCCLEATSAESILFSE